MRVLGRIVFFIFIAAIWLGLAALALEAYAAYEFYRIRQEPGPAPPHAGFAPSPVDPAAQDESKAPPFTFEPPDDTDHVGAFFADLPEADRAMYARLREELLVVYDASGNAISVYGENEIANRYGLSLDLLKDKPAAALFHTGDHDGAAIVKRTLESGKPEVLNVDAEIPGNPHPLELTCYPMGSAALCSFSYMTSPTPMDLRSRMPVVPNHPEWKIPWRVYRNHFRVSDHVWTNNVGFIGDDIVLPRPKDTFRILCVGGSTTVEGQGNSLTYPSLLQKKLRDYFTGQTVEVVNCGVHGLDSPNERRRTLDFIRLDPRLVVQYNFVNDVCHYFFSLWGKEATPWQKTLRRSRFINLHFNALLQPSRTRIVETIENHTLKNYRIMVDCFRSRGIEIVFCSFACPDYTTLSSDEVRFFEYHLKRYWEGDYVTLKTYGDMVEIYNERLRAFCRELGLHYIPVAENMRGGTDYFIDVCHMSQDGIDRKAQIIAEDLRTYVPAKFGVTKASP